MIAWAWHEMNKKLQARIANPKFAGCLEDIYPDMRVVIGRSEGPGYALTIYLLVDLEDGIIADAKYLAFGPVELFAVCELALELFLRKSYEKVHRLGAELIEKYALDKGMPLPSKAGSFINYLLESIEQAYAQCTDIPFVAEFEPPPLALAAGEPYPGWDTLDKTQRLGVIEAVIQKDIRPYIELDAGNIKIIDLHDNLELHIAYEGSCTTCYSATGATLHAIEQALQNKVHPAIKVIPNM